MWQHINNARLTSIFQTQYRSFRYQKVSILDFTEAKDEEGGGNNFTGDVQSSSQIITTNKQTPIISTGRMPFLSPNQQCEIAEGKRCQQRQTFQHVKIECVCVCVCVRLAAVAHFVECQSYSARRPPTLQPFSLGNCAKTD